MPGPKQKNVTIPEELWNLALEEAKKVNPENPSVAGWISDLIRKNVTEEAD